ncbi:hypothetical protein [Amycolatopsis keratiniphila]|uniref:hypothetical protein n=1 Tax=Amycolatopsis keratiniphila TaxID=129921 RepID=UPI000B32BA8C|nr:hypothetical protein [Amycolatopsis keratiniphila]
MTNEPEEPKDLVARTAGGVSAATLGLVGTLLFGPIGALVAGATSPLLTDGAKALERVIRRRLGRTQEAVDAAAKFANRSFEELIEIASEDDRRLEIVGRAVQAAALSSDSATICALGRALATGVLATDDAKVDESLRIVSTLASLDPIDVKVLERMHTSGGTWHILRTDDNSHHHAIAEEFPEAESVIDHVVARLSQQGLITRPDAGGLAWDGIPWVVTDFGRLCIETLRSAGAAAEGDSP